MNREKWAKLSPEEQRIKVAELCGWAVSGYSRWLNKITKECVDLDTELPDYLNDLNAMHEVLSTLPSSKWITFLGWLEDIFPKATWGNSIFPVVNATAAQRAEAFVLTMEPE